MFYVVDIEGGKLKKKRDIENCTKVLFLSESINYTVSKDLMILDLSNNTSDALPHLHLRQKDIVGVNETLHYSEKE